MYIQTRIEIFYSNYLLGPQYIIFFLHKNDNPKNIDIFYPRHKIIYYIILIFIDI